MRNIKYITIVLLAAFFAVACNEDDTNVGTHTVPDILIKSVKKRYVSFKGEHLSIKPEIIQQGGEETLSYKWFLKDSVVGNEAELKVKTEELGAYEYMLEVSNQNLKRSHLFNVSVISKYTQGLFVLSKTAEGSQISFKSLADLDAPFEKSVFKDKNPTFKLGKEPIMLQHLKTYDSFLTKGMLFVSTTNPDKLVSIDLNEMTVADEIKAEGKPLRVSNMAESPSRFVYVNFVAEDEIYSYMPKRGLMLKFLRNGLPENYKIGKTLFLEPNTSSGSGQILFDKANEKLMLFSSSWRYEDLKNATFTGEEFQDMRTCDRGKNVLIFTENKQNEQILNYYSPKEDLLLKKINTTAAKMTGQTVKVVHAYLPILYFAKENTIYQFNYKGGDVVNDTRAFVQLEGAKQIYSIKTDRKSQRLYVAYESVKGASENGSIACFDAETGEFLWKHENVVGEVVEMILTGF